MHSLPIFFINLDRSPERLALMQAQARGLGLCFERVPGIDGIKRLPPSMAGQFLNKGGQAANGLSEGEVGCYASHLVIMSQIIERKLEAAIVLEDDAMLDANFMHHAQMAVRAAPEGWDCLHLSTIFKRPAFPIAKLGSERSLVRYMRQPINSTAYIISRAGALKLAAPRPRTRPFDVEFRQPWLSRLEIYGIFPALAHAHEYLASTIEADWKIPRGKTARGRAGSRQLTPWEPNLASQIYGKFFVMARLGLAGVLHCWTRTLVDPMPIRPRSLQQLQKAKSP